MTNTHLYTGALIGGGLYLAMFPQAWVKIIGGLSILGGLMIGVINDVDYGKLKEKNEKQTREQSK